jgi:hypothetical protein
MAWIKLNATDPPAPAGSDGNVHFRQAPGHDGSATDPIPTSAFFNVLSWLGKLLDAVTMGAPSDGQVPTFDASSGKWIAKTPTMAGAIAAEIGGSGSGLTIGFKTRVVVPYAGTITGWTILGDVSGSAQVTVKKSSYSGFPSTTSIVASAPIVLASAQKATSSSLTGWTTAFAAGDIFEFWLDSATTCTYLAVELQTRRT